jgi:hypothetical protein
MADNYLPVVNDTTVERAATICEDYTTFKKLNNTCEIWDSLFVCLNIPTDWKYYNGGIYMPYAWVQESVVYDEDTANSLKLIQLFYDTGYSIQLWSFVSAGNICPFHFVIS